MSSKPKNGAFAELKDLLSREIDKKNPANKERHPTLYPYFRVLAVLLFVCGIGSLIWSGLLSYRDGRLTEQHLQLAMTHTTACPSLDPDDWYASEGMLDVIGENWSVTSSSSKGLMQFGDNIPLYSRIKVMFVPLSDQQVNFVLLMHDLYEVVVGDGSYQGVTLKAAQGKGEPMELIENTEGYKRNIFLDRGLRKGMPVTIVLDQNVSRLSNDSYEVNIRIAYYHGHRNTKDKTYATYDFVLPPDFRAENATTSFSMGLLAASDGTRVSAEIKCFSIVK